MQAIRAVREVLRSRGLPSEAKPRNGATRNDDGISERLPIAILWQMIRSECTNAKKGRGVARTYCAARSARANAAGALRASWAFRLLHNRIFNYPFGKHTQDDRGGSFSVGISCGRPMVAPTNKHLNSRGAHCASETNAYHRTTEKRTNL